MSLRSWVSDHRFVSFVAVTFAVTWTFQALLFALDIANPWAFSVLIGLGAYGPVIGAAVVLRASGEPLKPWAMQAFKWRVRPVWWLVALALPAVVIAGATVVFVLLGGELQLVGFETLWIYPLLLLYALIIGGGQEELGWRGFAQPHLQERYGAFTAAVGIGFVWAAWHAPLFLQPGATHGGFDVLLYLGGILAESVILAWLYNSTKGSVLLAGLFHAGNNAAMNWYPVNNVVLVDGVLDASIAFLGQLAALVVLALLVVAIVAVYGPRRLARHAVPRLPTRA